MDHFFHPFDFPRNYTIETARNTIDLLCYFFTKPTLDVSFLPFFFLPYIRPHEMHQSRTRPSADDEIRNDFVHVRNCLYYIKSYKVRDSSRSRSFKLGSLPQNILQTSRKRQFVSRSTRPTYPEVTHKVHFAGPQKLCKHV